MAIEWLGAFLKEYSGTIILISHDRYFLDEVVTKVLDMEDGEIELYHTNFSGLCEREGRAIVKRISGVSGTAEENKKMKEAIKRLREWANRSNHQAQPFINERQICKGHSIRIEKLGTSKIDVKKMAIDFEADDPSGKDVIITGRCHEEFWEQDA